MLGKLQGHGFVKRNPLGMKHAALRIRLVHNIECLAARHCRSLPRFHHQFALRPTQRFAARTDKNHHRIFNHDAGGQQFLRLNHAARGGKVRAEMEFSLCHIRDDLLGVQAAFGGLLICSVWPGFQSCAGCCSVFPRFPY